MPARLRAQAEGDGGKILRIGEGLGEQAVGRARLVEGGGGQGLVDQAEALFGRSLHAGDDEVEAVEGALRAEAHQAALRGVRVDVVEMREACGIFRLVRAGPNRAAMALPGLRRGREGEAGREEARQKGADHKASPGKARRLSFKHRTQKWSRTFGIHPMLSS